jgi:hypothetical protein
MRLAHVGGGDQSQGVNDDLASQAPLPLPAAAARALLEPFVTVLHRSSEAPMLARVQVGACVLVGRCRACEEWDGFSCLEWECFGGEASSWPGWTALMGVVAPQRPGGYSIGSLASA